MHLHHQVLLGTGEPRTSILFLHGILGRGSNLQTLAQRFIESREGVQGELIDLRAHGASLGTQGPDTVAAAISDVVETAQTLAVPATAVVGHSFGGKVALGLVGQLPTLEHVMTLDSNPGLGPGVDEVVAVLRRLESLEGPWPSRKTFVDALKANGLDNALAQWLAMNLKVGPEGFIFALDLRRIWDLLDSYRAADFWPIVEAVAQGRLEPQLHLVIAQKSLAYDEAQRRRAAALASRSQGSVTVDVLPGGHWVHAEDLQGTLGVLRTRLQ